MTEVQNKLKIAILTNTRAHLGGVTSDINAVSSVLRQAGHYVDIITLFGCEKTRTPKEQFVRYSDSILTGKGFKALVAYFAANCILFARVLAHAIIKRYDVYCAVDFSAANAVAVIPFFRRKLYLRTYVKATVDLVNQNKVAENSVYHDFFRRLENDAYRRAVKIIPNSKWSYDFLREIVSGDKVCQPVYTPIDVASLSREKSLRTKLRDKWGFSTGDFVILFPGRLSYRKGAHVLIEALSILSESHVEFKAVLLGGGPEENAIKDLVKSKTLENKLVLHGAYSREDIPGFNSAADCFVLPILQINDSMPISVLEAMASELPVIVSATAGIDSFVSHGTDGFLVPPNDPASLAVQLKFLIKLPLKERLRVGRMGRRKIIENCSPEMIARKIIDIFFNNEAC